jgi:hypothetical protein
MSAFSLQCCNRFQQIYEAIGGLLTGCDIIFERKKFNCLISNNFLHIHTLLRIPDAQQRQVFSVLRHRFYPALLYSKFIPSGNITPGLSVPYSDKINNIKSYVLRKN